jgi:hypothetical protein
LGWFAKSFLFLNPLWLLTTGQVGGGQAGIPNMRRMEVAQFDLGDAETAFKCWNSVRVQLYPSLG